jgi:CTP synthase
VIEEKDVDFSIYEVPVMLQRERVDELILKHFGIPYKEPDLSEWQAMLEALKTPRHETEVVLVGKYIELTDAYKSIYEALTHAGIANEARVRFRRVQAQDVERDGVERHLGGADSILVPGGFGDRGIEGKIEAIRYAREHKIPFFGICLGMQCACVEFARNVVGLEKAHSTEFSAGTRFPVISLLEEQLNVVRKGGTMRLGAYPCRLQEGTKAFEAYRQQVIKERHRHRYEFNNEFREAFDRHGMTFSGLSPDGSLVEIVELRDHPWFVGCQFHPEFRSKPVEPHPLFREFVKASLENCGWQEATRRGEEMNLHDVRK